MTYAGEYGRDEVVPVDWILHREWVLARDRHPLGVRRAEATRIATADLEAEASSNHLRWALGVAAGALLVAGTFAAGSLGGASGPTNTANSVPEPVLASLGRLSAPDPVVEAPAPEQVSEQQPQQNQPSQETSPASTGSHGGAPVAPDPGAGSQPATPVPAPAPAPAPAPSNQWGSGSQWGSGYQQWGSGSQWDSGYQQWSPVSGFGTATSLPAPTSAGPAMSMFDPFCNMTGK